MQLLEKNSSSCQESCPNNAHNQLLEGRCQREARIRVPIRGIINIGTEREADITLPSNNRETIFDPTPIRKGDAQIQEKSRASIDCPWRAEDQEIGQKHDGWDSMEAKIMAERELVPRRS